MQYDLEISEISNNIDFHKIDDRFSFIKYHIRITPK